MKLKEPAVFMYDHICHNLKPGHYNALYDEHVGLIARSLQGLTSSCLSGQYPFCSIAGVMM